METKQLIGVIVAIVVIGGGIWYFSSGKDAVAPGGEEGGNGAMGTFTPGKDVEGSGTLIALMQQGGAYRCTIDVAAANTQSGKSSGVVYIGNDRMRGDFTTEVASLGRSIESHMISAGGFVYVWDDMTMRGTKMAIATDGSASGTTGGIDASAAVDYHCSPWAVDQTRFDLPDLVTFTELQAQ